jgi:hypothetical protein
MPSPLFAAITLGFYSLILYSGCAGQRQTYFAPSSIETLEYYPFQVKGYENTYPKRRIEILPAIDARDFKDTGGVDHDPSQGHPAIGVITDQSAKIEQRLYGPPLDTMVQGAIARAAGEAGLVATQTPLGLKPALAARDADYLLATKITRLWLDRHRGPDNQAGETWFAAAAVGLEVAIYKPPFDVPFWQGESSATYDDPPAPGSGQNPTEDETPIYDQPGQELSVALTRAVAGVFKRESLRVLITQDSAARR